MKQEQDPWILCWFSSYEKIQFFPSFSARYHGLGADLELQDQVNQDLCNQQQITGLSTVQEWGVTPKLLLQELIFEVGLWGFVLIIFETFAYT